MSTQGVAGNPSETHCVMLAKQLKPLELVREYCKSNQYSYGVYERDIWEKDTF